MTVLVIGQNYWGHAKDLAGAKRQFRLEGGVLSCGYSVFEFPPELTFTGVDMIGQVHWERQPEHADIKPVVTDHTPRKGA
jgi:hypothetical protein